MSEPERTPEQRREGMERVLASILVPGYTDLVDDDIDGWVVVIIDTENGSHSYYGPCEDPVEALAWGEQFCKSLVDPKQPDEPAWTFAIAPLRKPES